MSYTSYARYVHEIATPDGPRWVVAEWIDSAANWQVPFDKRTAKLTGCSAEYARKLSALPSYPTRRKALRRARYLFGEAYEVV